MRLFIKYNLKILGFLKIGLNILGKNIKMKNVELKVIYYYMQYIRKSTLNFLMRKD